MKFINNYNDLKLAASVVAEGRHRQFVGGMWEEIGRLQFDYAVKRGLPERRLC